MSSLCVAYICNIFELLTDDVNVTNADDEESDNDIEDDQTSSESGSDEDIAKDFFVNLTELLHCTLINNVRYS